MDPRALSAGLLVSLEPSRDLTLNTPASTASILPRMCRGGCCWAKLADVASSRAKPATPKKRRVIWFMSSSRKFLRYANSRRHAYEGECCLRIPALISCVTADRDVRRLQRSVRLLRCSENE